MNITRMTEKEEVDIPETKKLGIVRLLYTGRGYGFIRAYDDGLDRFFHLSNTISNFDDISEGHEVYFLDSIDKRSRLAAVDVVINENVVDKEVLGLLRRRGVIKKLVRGRGYGFLSPEHANERTFFYHRSVINPQFDDLEEGMEVEYLLDVDLDGKTKAIGVRVVQEPGQESGQSQKED